MSHSSKISHFGDVLPSQSLGFVLTKLYVAQKRKRTKRQKYTEANLNLDQ